MIVPLPRSRLAKGIRPYSNLKYSPQDFAGKQHRFLKLLTCMRESEQEPFQRIPHLSLFFVFPQGRFW
jgi:hypothetical protein